MMLKEYTELAEMFDNTPFIDEWKAAVIKKYNGWPRWCLICGMYMGIFPTQSHYLFQQECKHCKEKWKKR